MRNMNGIYSRRHRRFLFEKSVWETICKPNSGVYLRGPRLYWKKKSNWRRANINALRIEKYSEKKKKKMFINILHDAITVSYVIFVIGRVVEWHWRFLLLDNWISLFVRNIISLNIHWNSITIQFNVLLPIHFFFSIHTCFHPLSVNIYFCGCPIRRIPLQLVFQRTFSNSHVNKRIPYSSPTNNW